MPPKKVCPEGEGWKWCPDCGHCRPLADFNQNQAYCREHQAARKAASIAAALARNPEAYRESVRAAHARYRERHQEKRNAVTNAWKRRNHHKVSAWYSRWAAANPEKRRASQQAYRDRKRLRPETYRFKVDQAPRPEYDPRDD